MPICVEVLNFERISGAVQANGVDDSGEELENWCSHLFKIPRLVIFIWYLKWERRGDLSVAERRLGVFLNRFILSNRDSPHSSAVAMVDILTSC